MSLQIDQAATNEKNEPPLGIEPRTFSLQDWRSATEL